MDLFVVLGNLYLGAIVSCTNWYVLRTFFYGNLFVSVLSGRLIKQLTRVMKHLKIYATSRITMQIVRFLENWGGVQEGLSPGMEWSRLVKNTD